MADKGTDYLRHYGIRTRETECGLRGDIVAMLTKLEPRGYAVNEDQVQYAEGIDTDTDTDTDADTDADVDRNRKLLIRDAPSRSGTASRSVLIVIRLIGLSSQLLLLPHRHRGRAWIAPR